MDGNAPVPDGQGFGPMAGVLAPLQQHVVGAGPQHSPEHQHRQQVGNQVGVDAPAFAQLGGQAQAAQHGDGNEQAIPAQGKGAQLENQGPRGGKGQGKDQKPSAACTFST